MNRWFLLAIGVLIALLGGNLAWHYAQMPATVASHFNSAGHVDSTMHRATFAWLCMLVPLGMALLFAGIAWLLPRMPVNMMNLPHKEIWFAPENRAATLAFLRRAFSWMGLLSVAMLVAVFHLTIRANLQVPPALGAEVWVLMGLFLAALLTWIVYFLGHFLRI